MGRIRQGMGLDIAVVTYYNCVKAVTWLDLK